MKKYILFPLFAVAIMCFSSCHSQKGRMDDLKDFVEKIQEEGKDYTLDQWEEANERFQKLLDKINSYEDLTKEELEEMAKLQGQYAATVFKNSGKSIMEQMQKAVESRETRCYNSIHVQRGTWKHCRRKLTAFIFEKERCRSVV